MELRLVLRFENNISNFINIFLFSKVYILLVENNFEIDLTNCLIMKLFKKMKP